MLYNGEVDSLDVLVHTEESVVDKFILCESTTTFQGKEKELQWSKNKNNPRFADVLDKIEYIIYDEKVDPKTWKKSYWHTDRGDNWLYEEAQRDFLNSTFSDLGNGDHIIIGDADEVYHPDAIVKMLRDTPTCGWTVHNCQWFNCRRPLQSIWEGPLIIPGQQKESINSILTRYQRGKYMIAGPDVILGWHLSYMGDVNYLVNKFDTFSHIGWRSGWDSNIPYNEDMLSERHSKRMYVGTVGGTEGELLTLDNNIIPPYVLENQKRFEHLIWKEDE